MTLRAAIEADKNLDPSTMKWESIWNYVKKFHLKSPKSSKIRRPQRFVYINKIKLNWNKLLNPFKRESLSQYIRALLHIVLFYQENSTNSKVPGLQLIDKLPHHLHVRVQLDLAWTKIWQMFKSVFLNQWTATLWWAPGCFYWATQFFLILVGTSSHAQIDLTWNYKPKMYSIYKNWNSTAAKQV